MANPREWTQLGTMLTSHRDYRLGDVQVSGPSDLDGYGTLRNYLVAEHDAIAETIMPLYLFDHSGLSMTTNAGNFRAIDSHGWDWGLVGYIFATPQGLADTGADPDPANLREQLRRRGCGIRFLPARRGVRLHRHRPGRGHLGFMRGIPRRS